jgi:hypothetical protein
MLRANGLKECITCKKTKAIYSFGRCSAIFNNSRFSSGITTWVNP